MKPRNDEWWEQMNVESPSMLDLVDEAVRLATDAHRGQLDKVGEPYIGHPLRVMAQFDDPELKMIAVLHDVIEDSETTGNDLRAAGFSERVVAAVEALTHPPGEPNLDYWERVRVNEDARLVKLADIADNGDAERLARLEGATAARLRDKYARAVEVLGSPPDTPGPR